MTEQLSYLAICLGGLEELVAKNLQQKLIVLDSTVTITVLTPSNSDKNSEVINNQRVYRGDSGCGRIKVITTASIEFIDSIRSVQYWFLLVVEDATVDPSKQKGLIDIENVLKAVNWGLIPSYWQDITHPKYRELYKDINKKNRKISFCGRCIRDGKHEFNSLDVAQAIGSAVLSTTDWVVDLTTMDFEIVCFIMNEKLTAGVNIPTESQRFLKAKLPSEVRLPVLSASLSPSLKPSTAYLLATLAKPSIGDVVLDCMCGSGALFTEATFNYKCIGIGGDVDMELNQLLLETLEVNRKMTNNRSLAEVSS